MTNATGTRPELGAIVRKLFDAMAKGRFDEAFECLSDDIHWEVAGDLPFCGPHIGKQAVQDNLFAVVGAQYVPGTAAITIIDMFEDVARSTVVTQILESADVVGGGRIETKIASFFLVTDGKVSKVQEFVDLRELDRLLNKSDRAIARCAP